MRFKIKIKMTVEREYEVSPQCYGGETDPEKMLAVDIERVKQDHYLFTDNSDASFEVVGEIIK